MSGQSYDPERHDSQLVAAFEQYSIAEAARDALLGAGVHPDVIELIGEPSPAGDGFWSAVRRLFAPDEEASAIGEAVHRGRVMVVVRPETAGERETAIEVMEGYGPLDLGRQGSTEAPSQEALSQSDSVRIVEERLRVGWRDRSGPASRVHSYVAERTAAGERVELLEEDIAPPANPRPGS